MWWRKLKPYPKSVAIAGASQAVVLGTLFGLCIVLRLPGLLPYLHVLIYPACVMLALVTLWSYRLLEKMKAEQREDRLRRYEHSTGTTYCRKCLYDLRSIEERCPECGTPIPTPVRVEESMEWRPVADGATIGTKESEDAFSRLNQCGKHMTGVRISIIRLVDPGQPGYVEGTFRDAWGKEWSFVEKIPIVTLAGFDEASPYPQPGVIACQIVRRWRDPDGRELVTIDTENPWGVESTTSQTRFDVSAEQLTEC